MTRKQLLINGEWRDASDGATMPVINPATEEVIALVAAATRDDVDAAVAAARAAFEGPWGQMPARERGGRRGRSADGRPGRIDGAEGSRSRHTAKPIPRPRTAECP